MPQIRVEYSPGLEEAFDRRGFAGDLHRTLVEVAGARLDGCKSKFVRLDEAVVGDGAAGRALVHAEIALFTGRSEEARAELGRRAAELLAKHVIAPATLSVEVREIDPGHYHRGEA